MKIMNPKEQRAKKILELTSLKSRVLYEAEHLKKIRDTELKKTKWTLFKGKISATDWHLVNKIEDRLVGLYDAAEQLIEYRTLIEEDPLGEAENYYNETFTQQVDFTNSNYNKVISALTQTPLLDRLKAHLDSITPEEFDKEIDDIIKNDTSVQVICEDCGMEYCECGLIDDTQPMKYYCVPKEISDEEIEQYANDYSNLKTYNEGDSRNYVLYKDICVDFQKWYREQLKKEL